MDCTRAQELLLDELDAPLAPAERGDLLRHLEGCETCRAFAALQRQLDAELRDSAPVVVLEAGFRRALDVRLAARQHWPEWLPELAYGAGAALATAATVLVLPFPVSSTWWIGSALAGLGLFVHSLVARALCELEVPGGC
jgi:anti-sigma factor RsiW